MVQRDEGAPDRVQAAREHFEHARLELAQQEIAAMLREREGLHYASMGDDLIGPHLVVFNGEVLGEIHTRTPGLFSEWYACPVESTEEIGPFATARACAAGLRAQLSGSPTRLLRPHGHSP